MICIYWKLFYIAQYRSLPVNFLEELMNTLQQLQHLID